MKRKLIQKGKLIDSRDLTIQTNPAIYCPNVFNPTIPSIYSNFNTHSQYCSVCGQNRREMERLHEIITTVGNLRKMKVKCEDE